jgi:hypothetical protein
MKHKVSDVADAESLVAQFGEQYRRLIVDAIAFLDETEPRWNLARPVNRREYIEDIIRKAGSKP